MKTALVTSLLSNNVNLCRFSATYSQVHGYINVVLFDRLVKRAVDEIPHHLSRLDASDTQDEWRAIWSDPGWLLTKLATSGVSQVLEDVALTPEPCRPESMKKWLVVSAAALDCDYRQLAGQLVGRGVHSDDRSLEKLVSSRLVPCLLPNQTCLRNNPDKDVFEEEVCISAIYRLSGGDRHQAAALSAVRDEMSLWDFNSGRCDRSTYCFTCWKINDTGVS